MGARRYLAAPHAGFTLVELMIALVLGLLISAAGLSIFLSSQRAFNLHESMGELQQNANFALAVFTQDLRHTNLNTASDQKINNKIVGAGIIFAKENVPLTLDMKDLETKFVSLQAQDTDSTTGKSDRLTIQYVPQTSPIINCEGREVTDATSKVIVQHYYLKQSPQQISGQPTAYSLYCDAGYYQSGDTSITNINRSAQQIMQRVDAFKVRFGVKSPAGQLRYMTINQYKTAMASITNTADALNIVSIEVGILARSTGRISAEANLNSNKEFSLAGQVVTLAGDEAQNQKYLRQVVNQVVAIRNTLGAS
ncbi:PilW family protein [Acinetobacter puyangensis]|nr:PilW family protein [Acinetobacter puyangensis]